MYLKYYTQVLTGEKKSGPEGPGYHLYLSILLWTTLNIPVNPSFAPYSPTVYCLHSYIIHMDMRKKHTLILRHVCIHMDALWTHTHIHTTDASSISHRLTIINYRTPAPAKNPSHVPSPLPPIKFSQSYSPSATSNGNRFVSATADTQ